MKVRQTHLVEIEVEYDTARSENLTGEDLVGYLDHRLVNDYETPDGDPYRVTGVTVWASDAEFLADRGGAALLGVLGLTARPLPFNDYPLAPAAGRRPPQVPGPGPGGRAQTGRRRRPPLEGVLDVRPARGPGRDGPHP